MQTIMNNLTSLFNNLGINNQFSGVLSYFLVTSAQIMILLVVGISIFSYIRARFLDDNLVKKLENKPKILVYLGMALLGIVSPFCSCSTIPAFVTFVSLGVPTGAVFVYLITSPLIQEASLILLITQFGVEVAVIYVLLGVITGLIAGALISKIKDSDIFNDEILRKRNSEIEEEPVSSGCSDGCSSSCSVDTKAIDMKKNPGKYAINEALTTLKSTYKYVLIGIAFGAFIHGMVPPTVIENLLGSSNASAPILATISGIPIYADDVALIPVAKSLIDKGAGLGTALSFVMASAVVSIPSFVLLAGVLKKKTIVKLAAFLTVAIIVIGYLFNYLQPILF